MEYITKSERQTINVAKKLGKKLVGGEIILLDGDLGAGKTHFTKGIAKSLGIKAIITSPTFTIMNMYSSGKKMLYHFDMYRIDSAEELYELGFEQYLGAENGIACVEWFKKTPTLFENKKCYLVQIEKIDDNKRKITIEEN